MDKIFNIPSMSMFNNNWELLLKFMENEGNPPFHFDGDLDLGRTNITTLGSLVSVGGNLDLFKSEKIKDLGNLEYVGGYLDIRYTYVRYLGNLKFIGGSFYTIYSPVNDYIPNSDIRKQIEIKGELRDDE